jgi:hypothetical protein
VTTLYILFLVAFTGGLLLAVFAMLHGIEYTRRNRSRAPSPFFNLPSIAAFAIAFGAVGYALASHRALSARAIILIALASAMLTTLGVIVLLARWALRDRQSASSEAEEIQGSFALVSVEITPSGQGEISYDFFGRKLRTPARTLSGKALPAGSEVVIDRIEDGVAFVEEWTVVEQRL